MLPGSLLPTEKSLMEEFGVSRSTVRRALKHLITIGWAESNPNRGVVARKGLNKNRKDVVGFVDHGDTLEPGLFFTLGTMLQKHGLHLVHVDSRRGGTESAVEECASQEFSAVVVWSKTNNPSHSRMIRCQQMLPILAVDHGLRGLDTDLITFDAYDAARTAVGHLAACGRRRIAISGMIDHLDTTQDRIGGYMEGLFEAGMQPIVTDMLFCNTSGMDQPDTRMLELRLGDKDRPDGVFIMQDSSVAAVEEAILRVGLRVPEDVAIISIGDCVPLRDTSIHLTTMAIDWDRVAFELTQHIVSRISRPELPTRRFALRTELVIRGSCGAPPALWSRDVPPATRRTFERNQLSEPLPI